MLRRVIRAYDAPYRQHEMDISYHSHPGEKGDMKPGRIKMREEIREEGIGWSEWF